MAFSSVPTESKNQINKAGQILIDQNASPQNIKWAIGLAEKWRACHAYPLNTFNSTLRVNLKKFSKGTIAAQRLKRMPTIINKLKRYHAMQLTTMQDIGGLRAILDTVHDVNKLAETYRNNKRLKHQLVYEKDYIQNPRSEDGYRSLHLIYKYKNSQTPSYDNLRLELQIRTKLQHTWATAVETMGTFLGMALKSRQGDQEWINFFAIISSAFAHIENTTRIPRYSNFSHLDTFKEVAKAEKNLGAIEKMKGFSVAVNLITKHFRKRKKWFYHLIILNSLQKNVQIKPYDRDDFKKALSDYSKAEADAAQGQKIEPVLVSAGPVDTLRKAYPNFFLDIQDFVDIITDIISKS